MLKINEFPGIDLVKSDIARLQVSHGLYQDRYLCIEAVNLQRAAGTTEYQLRCTCHELHKARRHWIRSIDGAELGRLIDALSRSSIPSIPAAPAPHTAFTTTEITLWRAMNHVTYTWFNDPPAGYESLARFASALQRLAGVAEYLGWDRELKTHLTEDALKNLAGTRIFARGIHYLEAGHVTELHETGGEIRATVLGTEAYAVRLWIEDGEFAHECACPMGTRGLCCKHVVAAGLAWVREL